MKRVHTILFLFLFPLLIFAQESFFKGKISPYTAAVMMPALQKENPGKNGLLKSYFSEEGKTVTYINAFIELTSATDLSFLDKYQVNIGGIFKENIITASIPLHLMEEISLLPEVKYIQAATPVRKKLDKARPAGNVDKLQAGEELPQVFTGKDVIIGIVDSGFEYVHKAFYDANDTGNSRIKRVWNQNDKEGTSPAGYTYGSEYKTQQEIEAARFDHRNETHGTHVVGIAAGADKSNKNPYYGIAPDADLVLVSFNLEDYSTDNISILEGINYIYNYADQENKPCVVNLSLGSHVGPHDGTSYFDRICDAMQDNGRLLVGAVGNEAGYPLHISTTNTVKTFLGFYEEDKYGIVDIWSEENKTFEVELILYERDSKSELVLFTIPDASKSNGQTFSIEGKVEGTISIYSGKNQVNNKANTTLVFDMDNLGVNSNYYVGFKIRAENGTVHAWSDNIYSYFTSRNTEGYTMGNSNYSTGEVGGTGKRIISVGAFFSKLSQPLYPTGSVTLKDRREGDIADFSSTGPTADGRIKPDITAPGALVVSTYSSAVLHNSSYSSHFVDQSYHQGIYYGVLNGTSMASPYVAGILATWLEANNSLSPEDVRTILQATAKKDTYTGTISGGSNTWGYGKIDAWAGAKQALTTISGYSAASTVKRHMIYPNPSSGQVTILSMEQDGDIHVKINSLTGNVVYTQYLGDISKAEEKTIYPALESGVYNLIIQGNKFNNTYRLIVK